MSHSSLERAELFSDPLVWAFLPQVLSGDGRPRVACSRLIDFSQIYKHHPLTD